MTIVIYKHGAIIICDKLIMAQALIVKQLFNLNLFIDKKLFFLIIFVS